MTTPPDDDISAGLLGPMALPAPSINALLVQALRQHAGHPLVVTPEGRVLTGAEIENQIARHVAAFEALGIGPGSRVALLSGNRVEVLYIFHALMLIGAVFVPLHPMGSPSDFAFILNDAAVETLIFDPRRSVEITGAVTLAGRSVRCLALDPANGVTDLPGLVAVEAAARIVLHDFDPEAICRLAYSGGTTGTPKAIQLSHRCLAAVNAIQMAEWEWPAEVRQLLCAPLSHSGFACFLPTILRGGTLYIASGFDADQILAAIERDRITCILLVPTMIYALLDHPRLDDHDLSSIETIFYGASAMSSTRLQEAIVRFGPIFFQFYGQSEAPMTVTILRRDEHRPYDLQRLTSCGRPANGVEVELFDAAGEPVPIGAPGELCVRGPLIMSGYLNRSALTEETLRDGWLHSGDIAVRDADGFLRIIDRSKDMVITGGFNVYSREVEEALESHPSVAAACVFGLPDERWGEIVVAAVELRPNHLQSAEQLIVHVRSMKGPVQAPKRIILVDAIPLTALGKPDKKAMRTANL